MDISSILSKLNKSQRQAVSAPLGHLRVIAGAGSGKTRVLVHRISWVISVENASPYSIIAVTFTNKAANEMRSRVENMLGCNLSSFWVGTFHSICHRMLRTHYERVGISRDFQILDRSDQLRLFRRIMKAHNIDESFIKAKQVINIINSYKENGKRWADLDHQTFNPIERQILFLYKKYEQYCQDNSLVDFAELLLCTVEMLRDDKLIRHHYQQRFRHILVDEFQDTNDIQYAFIQLLCTTDTDLLVVCDDDQSIYGFRGAKIENIFNLEKQFPQLSTIKLKQNYRSTGNILQAANTVIAKNTNRLGKDLWTEAGPGELIEVYQAINEDDEAYYIKERMKSHIDSGGMYKDLAILYRSNAQSRLFEEALMLDSIPYRIYGGLRFFDRAEIKDAVAYLRLVENHHDDVAFDRIINVPTRGIGARTLDVLRKVALDNQFSLWQAAKYTIENSLLPTRANNALLGFISLIDSLFTKDIVLSDYIKRIIDGSGLINYFDNKKSENREDKIENLKELVNAAEQFVTSLDEDDKNNAVSLFLAQVALDAGDSQASEYSDYVQLMTIHAAKGLEFLLVFIVGMEEGLFPHRESVMIAEQLAEERRLAYVGITRAKQKLHLSYAEKRRLYGNTMYPRPSRFIEEIPIEILNYMRGNPDRLRRQALLSAGYNGKSVKEQTGQGICLGKQIIHPKFGQGIITAIEGEGQRQRIQVNFRDYGSKWLILAFAKLQLKD